MTTESSVQWRINEIGEAVMADLGAATREILLVAPFIKSSAVERVIAQVSDSVGVTVVTAFRFSDFVMGASDIDALLTVSRLGTGAVRVLRSLHAKMYCVDWSVWWVGSANFTASGLGFCKEPNFEIMARADRPSAEILDVTQAVLSASIPVEMEILEKARTLVAGMQRRHSDGVRDLVQASARLWEEVEAASPPGYFMLQELPLCAHPNVLKGAEAGDYYSVKHDSALFGITETDTTVQIDAKLSARFLGIKIIRALDELLIEPHSFGAIAAWLHDRCEDRPVPYRSEIKDLTARVLTWLLAVYPDRYRRSRPRFSEVFVRSESARKA